MSERADDKPSEGEQFIKPTPRPGAYLLESTAMHAEYWLKGGREIPDRAEAIMAVEQSANAWKNVAYALAEKLHFAGYDPTRGCVPSTPSSTGTLTFEDYWKSIGRPDYSPSARSVIEDAFRTGQRTRSATEPKWLVRAGGDNYETWLCPGTDEVRKAFCEALYGDVASADAEDIEGYMRDLDKRIIEDNDVRWTFEDGWLEVIALNNPTDGGTNG